MNREQHTQEVYEYIHGRHREGTAVTTRKQALQAQIRALAAEMAALDDRPEEPTDPHAVVSFVVTFADARGPYHYAARKAGNRWYKTGGSLHCSRSSLTWDELLDFIETNNVGGLAASHLAILRADRVLV